MRTRYPALVRAGLLLYLFSTPSILPAQILDTIEVTSEGGSGVIAVNFSTPVHYIKHFPADSAKTLQIYLRVTALSERDKRRLLQRRTVRAPPGADVPLLDVTYEGDGPEGPHLLVRFRKRVKFNVRQGRDNRSIHIILAESVPQAKLRPREVPETPKVAATSKAAEPSEVPEVSAILDIVRQEPAKQPANARKDHYAVTLALSFTPIRNLTRIRRNLAEFRNHVVYQTTASVFGIKVYFIRLGFFSTSKEATVAKEKLRSQYPVAWVTLVSKDERVAALGGRKIKRAKRKKSFKLAAMPKSKREKFDTQYPYVINLESSLQSSQKPPKSLPKGFNKYRLYTDTFTRDGKIWRRLRLGFFRTKEEAQGVWKGVKNIYPRARIDLVSREERENSAKTALVLGDPRFGPRKPETRVVSKPKDDVDQLMAQGREALTRGDNIQAIRMFTKVLALPKNEHTQDAQEYLGLARERNGQVPLAKVEYKLYLKLYPDGEGADRVRQRLANLSGPETGLQIVEAREPRGKEKIHEWSVFGSLSQDYYHGASQVDTTTTVGATVQEATFSDVDQSSVFSHLDLTGRLRNTRYDNRIVFSGTHTYDLLESEDDDSRVSSAYVDILNRSQDYSARIGRQSGSARGVLSRFDGALAGYSFLPKWRVNVVAGRPTDDVAPESDRQFYGLSFDIGPFAKNWNSNFYLMDQTVDGMTDRQAVGAELRYFDPKRSLFSLIDYDVYFGELNIAMIQGSWQPRSKTTFNLLLDYRKTPPLQATNALLGQTMESMETLLTTKSEDEVKQVAEALTATSRLFTIGAVRPLSKRFQLGGDITVTNISETEGAGDLPPAEGTGDILTYSTQLIGSSLMVQHDVSVFSLSYTESDSFKARSSSFIERFPFKRRWRAEVGVRIYDQENDIGSNLSRITPAFRLDYLGGKNITFELEVAQEQTQVQGSTDDEDTTRDLIRLGYRQDF